MNIDYFFLQFWSFIGITVSANQQISTAVQSSSVHCSTVWIDLVVRRIIKRQIKADNQCYHLCIQVHWLDKIVNLVEKNPK